MAKALAAQGTAVLCTYYRNERQGDSTTLRSRPRTGPPGWRGPTSSSSRSGPQVAERPRWRRTCPTRPRCPGCSTRPRRSSARCRSWSTTRRGGSPTRSFPPPPTASGVPSHCPAPARSTRCSRSTPGRRRCSSPSSRAATWVAGPVGPHHRAHLRRRRRLPRGGLLRRRQGGPGQLHPQRGRRAGSIRRHRQRRPPPHHRHRLGRPEDGIVRPVFGPAGGHAQGGGGGDRLPGVGRLGPHHRERDPAPLTLPGVSARFLEATTAKAAWGRPPVVPVQALFSVNSRISGLTRNILIYH